MFRSPIPKEVKEEILNKVKAGESVTTVATSYGISNRTIYGWLGRKALNSVDINHQYIWIHIPDQNGVVERSHRTDDEEFYQLTDTRTMTLNELNQALEQWTLYYNSKRLHFSLNFVTPEKYLVSHI